VTDRQTHKQINMLTKAADSMQTVR